MSNLIKIEGYHTCSLEGGKEAIIREAPYISGEGLDQWLGQGYYFWTDDPLFAHDWGKRHYNSSGYAINKFEISISKDLLWDLVGNLKHQMELVDYMKSIPELMKMINKELTPRARKIAKIMNKGFEFDKEVTVSSTIWIFRELNKFKYKAIKASDRARRTKTRKFVPNRSERLIVFSRQQVVVYPEVKNSIKHMKWVHPDKL